MCPHFAVGKCFYGNNCKYKHPGQSMPNANVYANVYGMPGQQMPYEQPMMMNHLQYGSPMMMNHHNMPNMRMTCIFVRWLLVVCCSLFCACSSLLSRVSSLQQRRQEDL
jgi:hypothetical protein